MAMTQHKLGHICKVTLNDLVGQLKQYRVLISGPLLDKDWKGWFLSIDQLAVYLKVLCVFNFDFHVVLTKKLNPEMLQYLHLFPHIFRVINPIELIGGKLRFIFWIGCKIIYQKAIFV